MKDQMKSLLKKLATAALVASACFSLVACGANQEELIRKGLDEELGALKNGDAASFEPLLGDIKNNPDMAMLEQAGVDPAALAATLFSGFDYEIKEVKVSGDKADAVIHVKNKNIMAAFEAAIAYFKDSANADALAKIYTDSGEDGLMKEMMNQVTSNIEKSDDMIESDATLHLSKEGDTWSLDDESYDTLINAAFGDK